MEADRDPRAADARLPRPGLRRGRSGRPRPRASDADRDIAADILCAAVGDGRLTLDELDERLGAALSARTITELAALIADLPGRRCPPSPAGSRPRPGYPSVPPGALTVSRWSLVQSLVDTRAAAGLPVAG